MAALAIALVGLYDMWRLRFAPAGPHGFDDVSYHLSAVATWIRYGDLRMIRFSMGDPSTPFYPILGEIASWVLIAPFRDSDVVARWTQVFFAVFSFLAVVAISRRLGLSRRNAAFAAIAYAGIYHVFPVLSVSAGNDQSTSFFTLAGIDAALALARRPRPGTAIAAGAALGLLLATKYIGVLFAPVILAVLVLVAWIERRRRAERAPARTLAGAALLLAATMAVTGGYTYLRNAVTTGNPIFPAPVEILGIEIFPGWGGITTAERAAAPEFDIDVWEFLTRRSKLFGSYFPFTLLPAALLAPFLALWRRRWRAALTFVLPAVIFLQFLFLMPDHRDVRYFLPAVALAAVAFAWLLEEAGPRIALPVRGVVLAWITLQAVRHVGQSGMVTRPGRPGGRRRGGPAGADLEEREGTSLAVPSRSAGPGGGFPGRDPRGWAEWSRPIRRRNSPTPGGARPRRDRRDARRAGGLCGIQSALLLFRQPLPEQPGDRAAHPGPRSPVLPLGGGAGGALRSHRPVPAVARQPRTAGDRVRGRHPLALGGSRAALDESPDRGLRARLVRSAGGDLAVAGARVQSARCRACRPTAHDRR